MVVVEEGDVFVVEAVPAADIVLFVDDEDGVEFGLELLKAGEVLVPAALALHFALHTCFQDVWHFH